MSPRPVSLASLLLAICSLGTLHLPAQNPIISELMARNANTLADENGEYKDWFELHNPHSNGIHLGGYYLTDDPSDRNAQPATQAPQRPTRDSNEADSAARA